MRNTGARVVGLAVFSSPRPGPRKGGGRVERRRGKGVRGEGGKGGRGGRGTLPWPNKRGEGGRGQGGYLGPGRKGGRAG